MSHRVSRRQSNVCESLTRCAPAPASSLIAALLVLCAALPAQAQSPAYFYKGKSITFLVGAGAGASYDFYARTLAEHMGKHVPGAPKIIVKTTGGQSGGRDVAEAMSASIPPDGLTIAMTQQTIVLHQVLEPKFARYDARKWYWLGNMAPIRNMLLVWDTAKAQSVEEAKLNEIAIGATSTSSPTYIVPNILNRFAGTKFKIITGYKGVADLDLAMRRGEIEGRGASWLSAQIALANEIREKKVRAIVFASRTRDPSAPDVPTMSEVMPDEKGRKVADFLAAESDYGRSVFILASVPEDRAKALRTAFELTMKDKDFLEMAAKLKLDIEPTSGDSLAALTLEVIGAPQDIIDLAK